MFVHGTKRFFAPENDTGNEPEEGDEPIEGEEDLEGDEPEEEPEGDEPAADDEPAAGDDEPAPSRKETRIQKLARERTEEREARIRAEAKLEEAERTRNAPAPGNSDAARIRQEKLDLMTPEDRRSFILEEQVEQLKQGQALDRIRLQDATDKAAFDAKATVKPIYAKYAPKVEEVLANMRRNGSNAPRETVLAYVVGQAALEAPPKKGLDKDKAAAKERVSTAKGAPTSGRSDSTGGKTAKGDSLEAIEARLKGKLI